MVRDTPNACANSVTVIPDGWSDKTSRTRSPRSKVWLVSAGMESPLS